MYTDSRAACESVQLLDVTHLWPASCCMDGIAKKLFRECEAAEDERSCYCSRCKQHTQHDQAVSLQL